MWAEIFQRGHLKEMLLPVPSIEQNLMLQRARLFRVQKLLSCTQKSKTSQPTRWKLKVKTCYSKSSNRLWKLIEMNLKLLLFKMNNWKGNSFAKRYRFAVVDLDRSKSYPANYVCILPLDIYNDTRNPSAFSQIFGDKSVGTAQQLLAEALEATTDTETICDLWWGRYPEKPNSCYAMPSL